MLEMSMELKIQPGNIVSLNGKRYKIKSPLSLERALIESLDTEETTPALLADLQPDLSSDLNLDDKQCSHKALIEYTEAE